MVALDCYLPNGVYAICHINSLQVSHMLLPVGVLKLLDRIECMQESELSKPPMDLPLGVERYVAWDMALEY